MNLQLPQIKVRHGNEFRLVNDFHSLLDTQNELRKIHIENRCFGKKKNFIFSSKDSKIKFSHGIYEQEFEYFKPS